MVLFVTNSECSFPFHTLLADAVEASGGSNADAVEASGGSNELIMTLNLAVSQEQKE